MKIVITVVLLSVFSLAEGIEFSRCKLTRILKQDFAIDLLPDWICLIENESGRNTAALGGPNKNGSFDYGLFQINDGYWCKNNGTGGDCDMNCNELLDGDVTDDIKCAKKIYKRHGFNAWHGWTKRCRNSTLPDLSRCHL